MRVMNITFGTVRFWIVPALGPDELEVDGELAEPPGPLRLLVNVHPASPSTITKPAFHPPQL